MAWKKVVNYSFGFRVTDKKFWVYYTLDGTNSPTVQLFLTQGQFSPLAQMFTAAPSLQYETTGQYFASGPRSLP
ncbi:hypothetical protein BH09PSE6_BH09PSE6_11500 [soil metagenome]